MLNFELIIDACMSILNYQIDIGSGYSVSLLNVLFYDFIGFIALVFYFRMFR